MRVSDARLSGLSPGPGCNVPPIRQHLLGQAATCSLAARAWGHRQASTARAACSEQRALQVRQAATVAPLDRQLAMLHGIIQRHKEENPSDYKVRALSRRSRAVQGIGAASWRWCMAHPAPQGKEP